MLNIAFSRTKYGGTYAFLAGIKEESREEVQKRWSKEEQILDCLACSSEEHPNALEALTHLAFLNLGDGGSVGEALEEILTATFNTGIEIGNFSLVSETPDTVEDFDNFSKSLEKKLEKIYPGKLVFIHPDSFVDGYGGREAGELCQIAGFLPFSSEDSPDFYLVFCFDGTAYFNTDYQEKLPQILGLGEEVVKSIKAGKLKTNWQKAVELLLKFVLIQVEKNNERHVNIKQLQTVVSMIPYV